MSFNFSDADDGTGYLPSSRTWNQGGREATRSSRISVAPPLTIRNTVAGITITFDAPIVIWQTAMVTGPVEDGGAGRFIAKIIGGALNSGAKGDFAPGDLGTPMDHQIVEVWNMSGGELEVDKPVAGWLVGTRTGQNAGRPILLVPAAGASLPTGQYMGMGYMTTSQNQSGWTFPFFGAFIG